MGRRRPTARSDDRGTRVTDLERVVGHHRRLGPIDGLHVHELGHARVGLRDQDHVGLGGPHLRDDRDDLVRPVAAVAADRVGTPLGQRVDGGLGLDAHHRVAASIEGHRRDDRDRRGDLADPDDRRPDLLEIGHRLDPDNIDTTGDKRRGLLREDIDRLVEIERPDRHHDRARRADIARDERIGSGGFHLRPEQKGGHLVELRDPVLVAVQAHPQAVAAERVGQQDPRPGIEIAAVDAPDDVGLGQVPELRRIAEREPRGEQHRPHRTVGKRGRPGLDRRVPSVTLDGGGNRARSAVDWIRFDGHVRYCSVELGLHSVPSRRPKRHELDRLTVTRNRSMP